jgi:hypothetical protein
MVQKPISHVQLTLSFYTKINEEGENIYIVNAISAYTIRISI